MTLVTTEHSIDCEGACCCRCDICSEVGYWSEYDVTFPTADGEWWCVGGVLTFYPVGSIPGSGIGQNILRACITGQVVTVYQTQIGNADIESGPPDVPLYGSAGGTGDCAWTRKFSCAGQYIHIQLVNFNDLYVFVDPSSGGCPVRYKLKTIDCRTGLTFYGTPIDGAGGLGGHEFLTAGDSCFPNTSGGQCTAVNFPSDITLTPSASATWYQCGKNSDGTTYSVDVSRPFMEAARNSIKPKRSVSLPQVPRPTRCEYLGKREDFKAGCNGWLCGHGCGLGLPAVPGLYCQTDCKSYVPDPDYALLGKAGWLS